VTCDLRLNEPRYAKLQNIMKAKKVELQHFTTEELGVSVEPHVEVLEVNEPSKRAAGIKVQSSEGVVDKLKKLSVI